MAYMLEHIRHQSCRLRRAQLGDLVRLLWRACTNDMWVRLGVVRLLLLCSVCCRIRLVGVPCSKTCYRAARERLALG